MQPPQQAMGRTQGYATGDVDYYCCCSLAAPVAMMHTDCFVDDVVMMMLS